LEKRLGINAAESVLGVCQIPPKIAGKIHYMNGGRIRVLKRPKVVFSVAIVLLIVIAWAPWITDDYARTTVVQNLGGPDAAFYYLGENVTIKEIPITTVRVPFAVLVYFPGEAMFIVPFWGVAL
jgi:hypothetical protein